MKRPVFEIDNCVSCGICAQSCPLSCITLSLSAKQGKYRNLFPVVDHDSCIGCGRCADDCPMGCLEMEEHED